MPFNKGLNKDVEPRLQPEGTYRHAENAVIGTAEGELRRERGPEKIGDVGDGYEVVGSTTFSDETIALFLSATGGSDDQIAIFDPGGAAPTLISDSDISGGGLNFGDYVDSLYRTLSTGDQVLYWTDGKNPPRFLNVDKYVRENPSTIPKEDLKLFPGIQTNAEFNLEDVADFGGSLKGGTYQLAFAYVDQDGSKTNYFLFSDLISITSRAGYGADRETETRKSIRFQLNNLDTRYEALQIAVVRETSVELLPEIAIEGSSITYRVTGNEETTNGSLEEIVINRAHYETAETMTQQNGTLYMGNVTSKDRIDLQRKVNNIDVECVSREMEELFDDPGDTRADLAMTHPEVEHKYSTFKRGEAYAFYVSFLLEDGSETAAFHIPGRKPQETYESRVSINNIPDTYKKYSSGSYNVDHEIPDQGEVAEGTTTYIVDDPTASGSIDAELYDDNDQLVAEQVNIPYDSGDTREDVIGRVVNGLNNLSDFNSDFTASKKAPGDFDAWGVTITANAEGSFWNGYYVDIVSSDGSGTAFGVSNGEAVTTGGKNDNAPAPNHTLEFVWSDGGLSKTVTVSDLNGNDSTYTVASKYKNAILNQSNGLPYAAAVDSDDNSIVDLVSGQAGRIFNGTLTVNRSNGNTEEVNITGGFNPNNDKIKFDVFWKGLNNNEEVKIKFDPSKTKEDVAQKLLEASRSSSAIDSEVKFEKNGNTVIASTPKDRENQIISIDHSYMWMEDGDFTAQDWKYVSEATSLPSTHPLNHYSDGFNGTVSRFHSKSEAKDAANNMGYWENQGETYPDNDRWKVEDENGQVVDDLRGDPVRHHRIPEAETEPIWHNVSNHINVLGIRLKNIDIPDRLEDDIVGYRVYHAEKTPNNRLILDQSTEVHGWIDAPDNYRYLQPNNQVFEDEVWTTHGWPALTNFGSVDDPHDWTPNPSKPDEHTDADGNAGGLDMSLLQLHPFESMERELGLSGVTHVNLVGERGYLYDDQTDLPKTDDTVGLDSFFETRRVKGISYIDANDRDVQLESLGFDRDYDNLFGESKVVCQIAEDVPSARNYVVDLCQLQADIHQPFSAQNLVSTGHEGKIKSSGSFDSDVIFGGDVVIQPWYYKMHQLLQLATQTENMYFDNAAYWNDQGAVGDVPGIWKDDRFLSDAKERIFGDSFNNDEQKGVVRAAREIIGDTAGIKRLPLAWGHLWYDLVESRSRPWWRTRGEGSTETFYPASKEGIANLEVADMPAKFEDASDDTQQAYLETRWLFGFFMESDNWMKYNRMYSGQNNTKPAFPFQDDGLSPTDFQTRIIRSKTVDDGREQAWREFLEEDYIDLPQNRGALTNLAPSSSGLLIHMEESLFRTKGRKQLEAEGEGVFLGSGNIFRVQPEEFQDLETGHAGLADQRHARLTPWGYMWADLEAGKVYAMGQQEGLKEISRRGLRQWSMNHIDGDSDLRIGVDPDNERVFLHDRTDGWSLSYSVYRQSWTSFHDLDAEEFFFTRGKGFHSRGGEIYQIGQGDYGNYYGSVEPFVLRFAQSDPKPESQIVVSAIVDATVLDDNGNEVESDIIDTLRVWNDHQDTGEIVIRPHVGPAGQRRNRPNARKTDRVWKINNLRDGIAQPTRRSGLERLTDNTHLVEVRFGQSTDQRTIHMLNAFLARRTSKR